MYHYDYKYMALDKDIKCSDNYDCKMAHTSVQMALFQQRESKTTFHKGNAQCGGLNNDSTYYLYSGRSETRNGQSKYQKG